VVFLTGIQLEAEPKILVARSMDLSEERPALVNVVVNHKVKARKLDRLKGVLAGPADSGSESHGSRSTSAADVKSLDDVDV
jgi:hypothetical protein